MIFVKQCGERLVLKSIALAPPYKERHTPVTAGLSGHLLFSGVFTSSSKKTSTYSKSTHPSLSSPFLPKSSVLWLSDDTTEKYNKNKELQG
ncbi:MAG: hypothetical protein ACJAXW_001954 [Candidatus Azotimanducaceae bacterium]